MRVPTTGTGRGSVGGGWGGEFSEEFSSIQRIMNTNIDWIKIETVPEEICIITSISPHLILKSSDSFSDLFNLTTHELFGQSLRSLFCSIPFPLTSATTAGAVSIENHQINYFEIIQQNKLTLEEFYLKLESKPIPTAATAGGMNRSSSSYHHCVLTLISSSSPDISSASLILIPCVIYAYPIFYHEVVYREYYPGLVSILPESIGTTFSSECCENHPRSGRQGPTPSFLPPNGVLYYQLHINRIEEQNPTSPPEEESLPRVNSQNSSIIGNFTRIFSTSSIRSSTGLSRTDTSTTNISSTIRSRYLSSGSGVSANERGGSRQRGRISTNSQSTISIGSHPRAPEKQRHQEQRNSSVEGDDKEAGGQGTLEELQSEKSLEFDSVEGGLMLERTNTNGSLKSLNSEGGWISKY